jgi:AcrR family transcriptional regulator
MSRWAPDGRRRLEHAAMELYGERGFDNTTVAEIAERAGLTERTFFRHFVDKREVLFSGAAALQEFLSGRVDNAAAASPPMDAVAAALCSAGDEIFEEMRDRARQRQAIIDANPELHEREVIKLAALASALADALRRRGVGDPASSLAAESGIAVFKIAFEEWIQDSTGRRLAECIRASMDELRNVIGSRRSAAPR